MDQSVSRPQRWRAAVNRAQAAMSDIRGLQDERQEVLDQIQELENQLRQIDNRAKEPLSRFEGSVVDLIVLQSEYECWSVPDNLSGSRLQDKIYDVTGFDFKRLQEYSSSLEEFDADRAHDVL